MRQEESGKTIAFSSAHRVVQEKSQLCCIIALANLEEGKKVHYIVLEESRFGPERRLKYPLIVERYYADPNRPILPRKLNFPDWLLGVFEKELERYEDEVEEFAKTAFKDLYIYHKSDRFGLPELINAVQYCAGETNLIIIDHVHYFDLDDDNENRALKQIAQQTRRLAIDENTPIVLVAHLRKRDRANDEIAAGLDEFHGSSDLTKVATKVITMAPGRPTADGKFETFFRVAKNRTDSGVSRFLAREIFDPKKGGYEPNSYTIGWANQQRSKGFEGLARDLYPAWAIRAKSDENRPSGSASDGAIRVTSPTLDKRWQND
jgi:hypothetical protein